MAEKHYCKILRKINTKTKKKLKSRKLPTGFSNLMDDTTITIDSTPEKAKTLVMQATCLSCGFTHQQKKPLLPGYRYEITEEVAGKVCRQVYRGRYVQIS